MDELEKFFFDVLDLDINKTPSHKTNLPMKKNQSLSYSIDFDLNRNLYLQLVKFEAKFPFIQFEKINDELKNLHHLFPQYGKKPIPFKLVIDKGFKNLHYDYSQDKLYTFMNFEYEKIKFKIPIEKIEKV